MGSDQHACKFAFCVKDKANCQFLCVSIFSTITLFCLNAAQPHEPIFSPISKPSIASL